MNSTDTTYPVIMITGASSGIGAATAELFGRKGYRVVLAARRKDRLLAMAAMVRDLGGEALPVKTDVSEYDQIENLVDLAMSEYGRIDVLLNNAGIGRMNWLDLMDPESDIDLQLKVNLIGVIHTSRIVLPHMIRQQSGHIINMASMAALIAIPTQSIYAASKFGVRGFTQALSREVKGCGVRVSGIYPGGVATEFDLNLVDRPNIGIKSPRLLQLSAEKVAKVVWHVVRRPRHTVVIPRIMWLFVWLNSLAPRFVDWGFQMTFRNVKRGG